MLALFLYSMYGLVSAYTEANRASMYMGNDFIRIFMVVAFAYGEIFALATSGTLLIYYVYRI